jgi:DNA-binding Lrp family transcriptional regulator
VKNVTYSCSEHSLFSIIGEDNIMPTAYVLIKCEEGAEGRLISNLDGKDTIREIEPTVGHYDYVAKITSQDTERLDEVIGKIHRNDKVRSTNVLILNEAVEAA